jgi:hypothetical protein
MIDTIEGVSVSAALEGATSARTYWIVRFRSHPTLIWDDYQHMRNQERALGARFLEWPGLRVHINEKPIGQVDDETLYVHELRRVNE